MTSRADPDAVGSLDRPIVGVVGAGVMGAGIAQLALEAGHETILHDVDEVALTRGRDRIGDGLSRRAGRSGIDPAELDGWVDERLARLRQTESLGEVADEADVVIEAALESLDLKRSLFATLDDSSAPGTILATNTSALSIAAIAAVTKRPNRVIGLHFFNPAPLMALVEVVAGPATDPATIDAAAALVASWGKTPIRSADRPGFIVNRVNRPYTIEALRILEEEEASVDAIDAAMRAAGFPLGPFELMDLTGIDVTFAAATAIWEGLGRPSRLRPSPIQERLIAEGHLGRKTGAGFYRYVDGKRHEAALSGVTGPSRMASAAISARILAAIEAEARAAAHEGVATPDDIDLALRLGAAHPIGPFERAHTIGP
jgi:3-hydroxybutyryl-CoA dehydrogenase